MNPPLILASAPLARQTRQRPSHRSRRRTLAGVLATAVCALVLALPLLAGIAAGGMMAILTREHLYAEPTPAIPQVIRETEAAPVLSAVPQATADPAETAAEAAALNRALRRLYKTAHPRTADSESNLFPPPSA